MLVLLENLSLCRQWAEFVIFAQVQNKLYRFHMGFEEDNATNCVYMCVLVFFYVCLYGRKEMVRVIDINKYQERGKETNVTSYKQTNNFHT